MAPSLTPALTPAPASRTPVGAAPAAAALSAVPSTLRIPLAARALGERLFPQLSVGDREAQRLLAELGDDGALWLRDRPSVYGILARTRRFRALAGRFLEQHPEGHVVNLGCGLAHYFQWLDNGRARMTDADLPEVVALRRELLPLTQARHRLREVDLTDPGWWPALDLPASHDKAPVFVFAEGVLMYLPPATVTAVLACFGDRAPAGSVFAFDSLCWLAAGRARRHTSVRHTEAEFRWGPRRTRDLAGASARLQPAVTHLLMESYGWPYGVLGPLFQAIFGVPFYALYELHTRDHST